MSTLAVDVPRSGFFNKLVESIIKFDQLKWD